MVKKKVVTPEIIRKVYIEEYLKRHSNAEEFANFTEIKLTEFIRKHMNASFCDIYSCLDHNFYDRVRDNIAINSAMRAEDDASEYKYSFHLKTWSAFLESKIFINLFKIKVNPEIPTSKSTSTKSTISPSLSIFREETEGERKHTIKEREVICRNPKLRQQCIDKYGYQCQCCGMNFAELYGEDLGSNFIEVHHLKMISTFEIDGVPEDFLENLVPLCSNCHSMIHHIKHSDNPLRDLRKAYKGEKKDIKIWKED